MNSEQSLSMLIFLFNIVISKPNPFYAGVQLDFFAAWIQI